MVSLAGIWSRMPLCSPQMSYSLCPVPPGPLTDLSVPLPINSVFEAWAAHIGGDGGQDRGVLFSPTSSPSLSAVLGGVQSSSRAVGMEAARPPFRIDEGSRGTGVMLLPASLAPGLQMGAFGWGWERRRVQKATATVLHL